MDIRAKQRLVVEALEDVKGRDILVFNTARLPSGTLSNYARENKEPLAVGVLPAHTALVEAALWTRDIARHDRRRLSHAIWSVLSRQVL